MAVLAGCASYGQHPGSEGKNLELTQRAVQALNAFEVDPRPLIGPAPAPGVYLGLALDGQSPAFDGDIRRARDQLFLLARALYKKPKVLALDEATSHLDIANEQRVTQALAHMSLTRIIVAHRPETIAGAQRVVGLQRGHVLAVGQGSEGALNQL